MEVVSYNRYAGFFRRFIAFLLDSIIINAAIGLAGQALGFKVFDMDNPVNQNTIWVQLITMAYFVFLESSEWQSTIGKKLLGMKVVDENYQRITPVKALIRFVISYFSMAILCLGYIWIIFDDKKQGWHDKAAGTYVVRS
jgi:uncharacterized RDD family membrane protein YckC